MRDTALFFVLHPAPLIFLLNRFVSRGYWDPEESTREKWTNTYASELQERGLSQDFTGLSELLLGQAQPNQFQSSTDEQPTGWIWGSKCTAPGVCNESSAQNTALADMPRAYHDGNNAYGDNYNWYAATAETGTFVQTSGNTSDSLCPAGWQLPVNGNTTIDKSWSKLLYGSYGLISNAESSAAVRQMPLFIPFSGQYYWFVGTALNRRGSYGVFWSSTAHDAGNAHYFFLYDTAVNAQYYNAKVYGVAVRCVQK